MLSTYPQERPDDNHASWGLYFAERLWMLGAPGDFPQLPIWLPWLTIIVGFAVWITVHFYTEGRDA